MIIVWRYLQSAHPPIAPHYLPWFWIITIILSQLSIITSILTPILATPPKLITVSFCILHQHLKPAWQFHIYVISITTPMPNATSIYHAVQLFLWNCNLFTCVVVLSHMMSIYSASAFYAEIICFWTRRALFFTHTMVCAGKFAFSSMTMLGVLFLQDE